MIDSHLNRSGVIELSAAQIIRREYARHGFVVIPKCLTVDDIADFLADEPPTFDTGKSQCLQRFNSEAHWRRLVSNETIVAVLQILFGEPPQVVQSSYLPKPPAGDPAAGENGVAFHRDLDHVRIDPPILAGCWIALTDADAENGGLCVVPGSHVSPPPMSAASALKFKSSIVTNRLRTRDGHEWTERFRTDRFDRLDQSAIVPLEVPAGGAVFFDGRLVHGSFTNLSRDRARLVATAHFAPASAWVMRADLDRCLVVGA